MLSQVRDTLKGAVAWIFVVLLILAFAMFGVPEMRQFTGNAAITVGGERFSGQYVQSEFNRALQSRRNETGSALTQEAAIALGLHTQTISTISTGAAIDQFAEKMNLAIPREFVRDYLNANENFKNRATGELDDTVLKDILRQNNLTVKQFENRISEDLMRAQLIESLALNASAPIEIVDAMMLREVERRMIAYVIVTDDMAGLAAEPTPADLEAYYQANPSQFTAPEYRTFDLVVLRTEDFREDAAAPEEELQRIYEINKPRLYDKPERRTLYQLSFDTEPEARAAAGALEQGGSFEALAAERGLTLADVTFTDATKSEILDPAVGEAAFKEDIGEGAVVGPVQSVFGWKVAQVAGITPPETQTFEEVREDIENQYLDQDTRREMLAKIDEFEEARDGGADLAAAAQSLDLKVETVGPIDRYSFAPGGAIIDKVPGEALAEIFSLDEGDETEAMELAARDGYFFATLHEITPPALRPFEDVRDDVEQAWRNEERRKRIADTVKSLRDAVADGKTLEEAAGEYSRAPTEIVLDRRFENEAISQPFNEQIFAATKGDVVSGPAALGEAQIVAEIRRVGFAVSTIPPEQTEQFAQYVGYQFDQEFLEAFITAIRLDTDIKVNQAQLDAIFGDQQ